MPKTPQNNFNYKVRIINRDWPELLGWLIDYIGPLLHCSPIIFWHGKGWHMNTGSNHNADDIEYYVDVSFTNKDDAIWFALRWK